QALLIRTPILFAWRTAVLSVTGNWWRARACASRGSRSRGWKTPWERTGLHQIIGLIWLPIPGHLMFAAVLGYVAIRMFRQPGNQPAPVATVLLPATPCQLDDFSGRLIWDARCARL